MVRRFGKKDGVFLGILAGVLCIGALCFFAMGQEEGAVAEVTVDGKLYGAYPLNKDRTVDVLIGGTVTNVLVIRNGEADVTTANCPDKLCVCQKAISHANETIVCLPNKVVIEIKGGGRQELDVTV